jgi:glutathione S-transferase
LEYERSDVDVVDRSYRLDLLGDLNPALRVPTLVLDEGRPLAESNAILFYFAQGTPHLPEDRYELAQVLQWLFFKQYSHEPNIAVVRFWVAYSGNPPRGRALHDRGHLALRLHPRGGGGRVRPDAVSRDPRLARPRRRAARPRADHGLSIVA